MTSASSSTEKIKNAGFFGLFSNILRQKWTTMLLSAILMFFTLPVPVMMVLSSYKNSWRPTRSKTTCRNICSNGDIRSASR